MRVPANFEPRSYQLPFLGAMDGGKRRACLVWHRRGGKTKTMLNFAVKKGFERVGNYYHCFPEYGQGRKVIWDGIDRDGHRILDWHIPPEIRRGEPNKTELKVDLVNGSTYQIIGADNYNSVVGTGAVGLILDEWAVSDRYPMAWDYFRPILAENGGWAVFPFTPRGRNHGWDLYQMALRNKDWFCQLLTVDDTKAIGRLDIEAERQAGMPESMIQQEFYCSFLASTGDIVIPFELIQGALRRQVDYSRSGRVAGLDVARFGNDRTAIVIRQGGQIIHVDRWSGNDLTQTVGKVISLWDARMYDCIAIDAIGIGAGVYDMVKNSSRRIPCVAVNVSESPSDSRFRKLRDELWWRLREWFQDGNCSISSSISEVEKRDLIADIQDIKYKYSNTQQIVIEPKEDMKERLGFSPDIGDALCCTFSPRVDFKVKEIERTPFHVIKETQGDNYNPLTYRCG